MPSPSESGQPLNSNNPAELGQASLLFSIPSPSSSGHPLNSGKPAIEGQSSCLS